MKESCEFLLTMPPLRPTLHDSGKTAFMPILLLVAALISPPPHKSHMDFWKKATSLLQIEAEILPYLKYCT